MAGLGAGAEHRVLHLDEIADEAALLHHRAGAQPRERADLRTAGKPRALDVTECLDVYPVRNLDAGAEHDIGLDRHVLPEHGVVAEEHGVGCPERRARSHRRLAPDGLPAGFHGGELGAAVDPSNLVRVSLDHHHRVAPRDCPRRHVGEVVFALRIVVADGFEERPHIVRMRDDQA